MQIEPLYFRLFAGLGVKTMGYFFIAAGIFLSIGNAYLAIRIVYLGVFLVALGWIIVIRTLRMSGARTRTTFAAYLENGLVEEGDTVTVRGVVGDKSIIRILLNGFKVSEIESSGEFCARFPAPKEGKYEVEVRFVGAAVEPKKLKLQVVRKQEMDRIRRIKRIAYGAVIATFVTIFVILVVIII